MRIQSKRLLRKACLPQLGVVTSPIPDEADDMTEIWNCRGYKRRLLSFHRNFENLFKNKDAICQNKQWQQHCCRGKRMSLHALSCVFGFWVLNGMRKVKSRQQACKPYLLTLETSIVINFFKARAHSEQGEQDLLCSPPCNTVSFCVALHKCGVETLHTLFLLNFHSGESVRGRSKEHGASLK